MKVCVFKPTNIVNNNPFDTAQRKLFEELTRRYGVQTTLFVDAKNEYHYDGTLLQVHHLRSVPIPRRVRRSVLAKIPSPFYPLLLSGRAFLPFDVVLTENPWYGLLDYVYLAHRLWGVKFLLNDSLVFDQPVQLRERRIVAASAGIVAVTPLVVEKYKRLGLAPNGSAPGFWIAGHPIDVQLFRPLESGQRLSQNRFTIVSTGRLVPEKGFHILVQAIAQLREAFQTPVNLWIIGSGGTQYEQELGAMICQLGLEDHVQFFGEVANNHLPELYANVDIYVGHSLTTSHSAEAFGVANLEAMACGLPVVTTDCGAVPMVVRDKALIVRQDDVQGLTDALMKLIHNEHLRKRLSAEGIEFVRSTYSVDTLSDRLFECLNEVCASG